MAASSGGAGTSGSDGAPASGASQMGRPSSFMSLVDGPGKKPVIKREDIEKRQRGEPTDQEARQASRDSKREQRDEKRESKREESRETKKQSDKQVSSQGAPQGDEFVAELEKEFAPKKRPESRESEGEDAPEGGEETEGRADKRIRGLNDRLKGANETIQRQAQAFQQRDQQYQAAFGQMSQAMQELREQNIKLTTHIEHLLRGSKSPQEEQDPISQLKEKMGLGTLEQENKALKERLEKFEQTTAQKEQEAEVRRKQGVLSGAAKQAVREHLLTGFSEEAVNRLGRRGETLSLALAWGRNIHPADAAKQLRQWGGEFALELFKSKSEALKKRQEQSRDVSPPSPNGRSNPGAQGNGTPSWKDMKELDPKAKDALDGMFRRDERRLIRAR